MVVWKFKACPKCHGDCFVDMDVDKQWYMACLQCGWQKELQDDPSK